MELPFPGGDGVVKLSKIRVRFYGIIYVSKEKLKEGVVFDTSFVFSILVYSSLSSNHLLYSEKFLFC